MSLAYPTFGSNTPVVVDGDYHYTNMFDVVVDSFYSALEKLNYGGANVYVAETGWPTRGNPPYTSVENARTYNQGLLKKFTMGSTRATLRRPNVPVVTFFFEMFDEVEQGFGLSAVRFINALSSGSGYKMYCDRDQINSVKSQNNR